MRIMYLAALLLAIAFGTAGPAAAAGNTWLPQYHSEQHVYVDPEVAHSARPLNVDEVALEKQVVELAQKHGLSTYVIITQQGDELRDGAYRDWARDMIRGQVYDRWSSVPGFDTQKSVILLVVRSKAGDHVSVAATCGDALRGQGLTKDYFNRSDSPVNRHVVEVRDSGVPGIINTLADINYVLDGKVASGDSGGGAFLNADGTWTLLLILLVFGGGATLLFGFIWLISSAAGGGGRGGSGGSSGGCGGGGCGGGGGGCGGGGGA